jgi:hypothetical protein
MHLSESVYYTVQSCTTAKELWKTLSDTYENKVAAPKIYLIRRLYNLRIKEFDSITAHLNDYEGVISELSAQGMTIDDELKALLLMSGASTVLGNLHHDHIQRMYYGRKLLLNYELHSI